MQILLKNSVTLFPVFGDHRKSSGAASLIEDQITSIEQAIRISMDGRGCFRDKIFIERVWWTLKHHYVYLRAFENGAELRKGLRTWFGYYNEERFHQSLEDWTPDEIYFKRQRFPR